MKQLNTSTGVDYRRRVCQAMDYIHSHLLDEELSLEAIAQSAHFSPFHFHRIFCVMTGETVFGFIRRLRLEYAAGMLLSHPERPVTDIAMAYGFSSSQNFARAFRVRFGMSPSDYRKSKEGHTLRKQGDAHVLRMCDSAAVMEWDPSKNPERKYMIQASVKDMPRTHVAYVRKIGPYGKETCSAAFNELFQWAGPRMKQLGPGRVFGVYWDDPEITAPAQCRVDACIEIPPGTAVDAPLAEQDLCGGPMLVCEFEIAPTDFTAIWKTATATLIEKGLECREGPYLEVYHDDLSGPTTRVDICIPVK